jgi:hypothetical protein
MYIPEWVILIVMGVWAVSVLRHVDGKTLSAWVKAILRLALGLTIFYFVIMFVPDWALKLVGAVSVLNFMWNLLERPIRS